MLEIRKVVRWLFISGYSHRKIFFKIAKLTCWLPNALDRKHDPQPAIHDCVM